MHAMDRKLCQHISEVWPQNTVLSFGREKSAATLCVYSFFFQAIEMPNMTGLKVKFPQMGLCQAKCSALLR